jgi:PHP family Zn ribbon phosphoesterase
MSWYIGSDESNLTDGLEGTVITLEAFGDEVEAKIMLITEHADGEKIAWLNLARTETAEMEELLGFMNEYSNRLEMTIKPTKSFRADQIFPVLNNSWTLEGSMEAFQRAKRLCKRIVEDTII